jgi:hypothetical protein
MMAKAKQPEPKPKQTPKALVIIAWLLAGEVRSYTWTLLAVLGFGMFSWMLWRQVEERVISGPEYQVTSRQVEITPLPQWIRADVTSEVIRSLSLDAPLSVLDDKLTERIYDGFSAHPWVAEVERVTKHHPARVRVDLVYRRPVCMVEVAPATTPGRVSASGKLLPVDVKAVLLPDGDFSLEQRQQYPRVSGILTAPLGPPGVKWGDPRVSGAAQVASVLVDVWNEFSLERIVASPYPEKGPKGDEYSFELFTKGGTRILWGHSPSTFFAGEVPALEKVARLRNLRKERGGTLEGGPGTLIDVRDFYQAKVTDGVKRTATRPTEVQTK